MSCERQRVTVAYTIPFKIFAPQLTENGIQAGVVPEGL